MASIQINDSSRIRSEGFTPTWTPAEVTVCFWIRPTVALGVTNKRAALMSNSFVFRYQNTGTYRSRLFDLGTTIFSTLDSADNYYTLNGNTFVTITLNSSAVTLYKNAVQEAQDTTALTITAPSGFHLGETTDALVGEYANLRLFSRVLSTAEIQTIYASQGRDDIYRGATVRWNFTEKSPSSTLATGDIKDPAGNTQSILSQGTTAATYGAGSIPVGYRRRAA